MLEYQQIPELNKLTKAQLKNLIWHFAYLAAYYRRYFLAVKEYLEDIAPTLLDFSRIPDIVKGDYTDQEQGGEASSDRV